MLITDVGVNIAMMLAYEKEKTYFELSLRHSYSYEFVVTDFGQNGYYARDYLGYDSDIVMHKFNDILVE